MDRKTHGHRRPDRRQPPQCLEKHRPPDRRGQGGVEPKCVASWDDRAGSAGARRGPTGFPAVSVRAEGGAGAAGCSRGGARRDRRARGLAASARLAGGGGALQSGGRSSAAGRAHDDYRLRGEGRPRASSRAHDARPRSVPNRNRRNCRSWQRNPICGHPDRLEPLGVLGALAVQPLPLGFAENGEKLGKTAKNRPEPARIAANSARHGGCCVPTLRSAPRGSGSPRVG